ncbi:hypothetical protein [Streptacidiphilus jiangxiensis]|uniref:Uncharacterized protein n=1 Tax=Streptacidiphilus jiangxiensis TaxID=235985 RepID=A0A1H7S9D3_STRJI|nr:hypothetical protein [Streptacidiphilus jiangxiensis]SEL69093.1 hypothetical protein SAMN05414137_111237 [Streptacidiphilus jiangxiensis]
MTSNDALTHPRSRSAFRTLRTLVGGYVALSASTLAVAYAMRGHTDLVTATVWIRGAIVALASLLMLSFVARAAHGSPGAFRRLRITSTVMLVAIVVIASLPGLLPVWMRVEQGMCGALLLGVVAIANGRHLRSAFAAR